jgi:hypothetical protein
VTSITTRVDPLSLEELYDYLLTHEQCIAQQIAIVDLSVVSVNLAQKNLTPHNKTQWYSIGNFGRGHGRGCGRGLPNFSSNFSTRIICQAYLKPGHTAKKCNYRFDHAYQVEHATPTAYITAPHYSPDQSRYDMGSTNHLKDELSNMNLKAEGYTGFEQIRAGNGKGMEIHHTSLAFLPSAYKNFSLKALLHVPQIEKNLISVNQFTKDNNVFIEFHPYYFCVKDLRIRSLLHKVRVEAGFIHGLHPI